MSDYFFAKNSVFLETHSEPVFTLDGFTSSPISLITVVTYTIQKRNTATKKLLKVKVELCSLLIVIDRQGNLFNFDLSSNPHVPVKKDHFSTASKGRVIAARYTFLISPYSFSSVTMDPRPSRLSF